MSCNAVSAAPIDRSYVVLGAQTERGLAAEVELYLERGFLLVGGIAVGKDGRFHQSLVRRPGAPSGEIQIRESKRREGTA